MAYVSGSQNNLLKLLQEYQNSVNNAAQIDFTRSVAPLHSESINSIQLLGSKPVKKGNTVVSNGVAALASGLSDRISDGLFGDSEVGRNVGTVFSQGLSTAGNTIAGNINKGFALTEGLGMNSAEAMSGAAVGIGANYLGRGINALGGDSMLSRGIGLGIGTAAGIVGGQAVTNLFNGKNAFQGLKDSFGAIKAYKHYNNLAKAGDAINDLSTFKSAANAAKWNLAGMGGQIVGTGLLAAFGPSKEYGGKYGNITQTMDTAYDLLLTGVGFIPGAGTAISGAMALNKGLSNIFGSTSGMTKLDAILGSAFMPAPVKWLNMAGAKTTGTFNNLSWLNSEKTTSFMGNAFGNLQSKFDRAREEAGKTYGTFSGGAYRDALDNLNFANYAWDKVLAMADLNELLKIRSLYMTSINNLRYAQNIQGGWSPLARGKYGMKILNNATNHNIGMRLLSAAALIDSKQMILSAQTGIKIPKLLTAWLTIEKSDNTRVLRPVVVEPIERKLQPGLQFFNNHGLIIVVEPKQEVVLLDNRDSKVREESHKKSVQVRKQELMKKAEEQTALVAGAILERTMPSYWVEKATGEDLGTVGSLAVDLASPYALGKGILLLGKTGQVLTKVPNIVKNKGFATVLNTPWNTTKIKWRGLGNNSYIELENNGEWLKPKMMESTYHGTGRKLYDAAIEYALNNGYKGIMSGENLLSAPKTYNIWRHYPNKILLDGTGSHSNAKMVLGSPFYKEVSTEKELLDATKNNVKAYREGPIIGLTEPSLRIYLRNKAGLLVKVPILKTIQLKSGITKSVLDNGKIRLSLPSHTDNKPRQFVLEPARDAGDNKYYVHMRMWDDVENKIPASNVTNEEKQQLFDALYDELPKGAEILFPKSGPGNYGTRGTIAGLQRLSRDPRFTPGTKGTLQYLDKDGKTVKTYEGTSFIKTENGWQGNRYVLDQTTLEGILNFIDNDIIPRILAQGHNVSSYTPTFRQFSPKTDAFDEAMSKANSGSGAWFTPASNDITIRGPLEKQDFGLTIHEAGGHGLRYNMLPDYIPTKREYLNEYIMTGGKDMSDKAANALLKMHTGDQIYNIIEAQKLRESYPWIKTYFERNPVKKSGDVVLRESGSVNTQFRSHYSNNGKIVGKELDEAVDKASPGVVLRDLIELPYTSSIIDDIAKITGKDPDALYFYGPEMLEKLVNQYPKLLEIVFKVKDTMKTVGSYGVPVTVGGSAAATLYNTNK